MISILSSSHYIHKVDEGDALPSLDAILKPLCREPFRRIDRFIQLALMGSAQCVQAQTLDPHCGLYVGTGIGPAGNNVIVQETLFRHHLLPKPFNFVNTLGSSTGYYVSKNLGLSGQALFISRRGFALEAALMQVVTDLDLGIVKQALLGVVEECTLPLRDHRRRQVLPDERPMAEGSHWILLQAGDVPGKIATLELKQFENNDALETYVKSEGHSLIVAGRPEQDWSQGYHDSLNAKQLAMYLSSKRTDRLGIGLGQYLFIVQNDKH